jgi:hypothetical protein
VSNHNRGNARASKDVGPEPKRSFLFFLIGRILDCIDRWIGNLFLSYICECCQNRLNISNTNCGILLQRDTSLRFQQEQRHFFHLAFVFWVPQERFLKIWTMNNLTNHSYLKIGLPNSSSEHKAESKPAADSES